MVRQQLLLLTAFKGKTCNIKLLLLNKKRWKGSCRPADSNTCSIIPAANLVLYGPFILSSHSIHQKYEINFCNISCFCVRSSSASDVSAQLLAGFSCVTVPCSHQSTQFIWFLCLLFFYFTFLSFFFLSSFLSSAWCMFSTFWMDQCVSVIVHLFYANRLYNIYSVYWKAELFPGPGLILWLLEISFTLI